MANTQEHNAADRNNIPGLDRKLRRVHPNSLANLKRGGGTGKPKGTKNRYTHLKEKILEVIDQAEEETNGRYLIDFALNDPGTFLKIAASLLPRQIEKEVTTKSASLTVVENMTTEEKQKLIDKMLAKTARVLNPTAHEKTPQLRLNGKI